MKKSNDFFKHLNNIFYKQNIKYDSKILPAYLLSLWLSHDASLLEVVNDINDFHFLIDDNIIQKYYYYQVPKGKRYLKWIKKEQSEEKEKENCKELGISRMEYRRYKDFIK